MWDPEHFGYARFKSSDTSSPSQFSRSNIPQKRVGRVATMPESSDYSNVSMKTCDDILSLRLLLAGMPKVANLFFLPATLLWLNFFSGWLSPCQIQRRRALGVRDVPVVGIHVPDCKADGGYHPVQCNMLSGYCWCVDEYGYEVKGSRIKGRPSCGKGVYVTYKISIIDTLIALEDKLSFILITQTFDASHWNL